MYSRLTYILYMYGTVCHHQRAGRSVGRKKAIKKRVGGKTFLRVSGEWHNIKVANYSGFLRSVQLSSQKVKCWQDRYSRFFSGMKLEISDIYYWGKLYDQFLTGRVGIE